MSEISSYLSAVETKMKDAIDHLSREFASIRTGRASTALVENLKIDNYGQAAELRTMASISTPDATTIMISPWDKAAIPEIEKAIIASSLGLAPSNDGAGIRLTLPPMSEESRRDVAKVAKDHSEHSRVSIRTARDESKKKISGLKDEDGISEDEIRDGLTDLQKLVDKYNIEVDHLNKEKEDEIMKI